MVSLLLVLLEDLGVYHFLVARLDRLAVQLELALEVQCSCLQRFWWGWLSWVLNCPFINHKLYTLLRLLRRNSLNNTRFDNRRCNISRSRCH
jgi:hypothetical protein